MSWGSEKKEQKSFPWFSFDSFYKLILVVNPGCVLESPRELRNPQRPSPPSDLIGLGWGLGVGMFENALK